MRPLVLVDVDGVLNALGPPDSSWPDWQRGSATALGRSWPIRWSPSVVAAVRSWIDQADVRWLTTWGHDANGGLHTLLGLPELPVAGTHADVAAPGAGAAPGAADAGQPALAGVTPAAPDELSGRWWKFDIVRLLLQAEPARRLVWLDDDLARSEPVRAWTRAHTDCLLIAPDPRTGLVGPHLRSVERFLAAPGGP
ncbi:MAG TPA: hypothetical protein VFR07_16780 [Mycobacteriales bacterium]|jgi:hypothetical protein|nr:hypothetical protein [Mycobacteriales bacterium]